MSKNYAHFELPTKEIGRALACASDDEQSEVLNSLGMELKIICGRKVETQHCYFASKLDAHGRELVTSLADFVKIREEQETKK
jgi:hypothetical protein